MNDKQLEAIFGLMAGMQLCITHLANVVARNAKIDPEEIAASFEETARLVPEGVHQRELVQIAVRQVAAGIRDSAAGAEWSNLMDRLRDQP